jgi:hypothetical protein
MGTRIYFRLDISDGSLGPVEYPVIPQSLDDLRGALPMEAVTIFSARPWARNQHGSKSSIARKKK